jgi:glutaconyl-CoA/methylmalonyl-CoA decarboxylase subunit gamma
MIKKLRVTVDGKPYDVMVEMPDESDASPATPPPSPLAGTGTTSSLPAPIAKASAAPGDVPSPLMGRVVGIDVKPGQEVKQGEQLLTIETMKMNTFVLAPKTGKVTEVLVSVGDAVEEGSILARIA